MNITINLDNENKKVFDTYLACFIVESETSPKEFLASSLADIITNGFDTDSTVYDYCNVVFSQQNRIKTVLVVSKRLSESYFDAYLGATRKFSFVSIESKKSADVISFSNQVLDEPVLFLYSGNQQLTQNKNTVWCYYNPPIDSWLWDDDQVILWDDLSELELE